MVVMIVGIIGHRIYYTLVHTMRGDEVQWSGTLQQNCEAEGSNVAPEVGKGLGAWLWQSLLYDKMFKAN